VATCRLAMCEIEYVAEQASDRRPQHVQDFQGSAPRHRS
jgi:hypothetical protein